MKKAQFSCEHSKDDVIKDFHDRWSIRETCDSVTLESSHPLYEGSKYPPDVQLLHTYECKDNEVAYFKVGMNLIKVLLPKAYLGLVWKAFEMSFGSR